MLNTITIVGAVYVVLVVLVLLFADRLIFPAPPAGYRAGELEGYRELTASDGTRLSAVHLPNPEARFTILLSHGNGEDLASITPMLRELHRLGFAVLAYDYRGYGASEGRPGVRGSLRDVRAVFEHLTGDVGVPADRVIVYGRSVGGGPSVHLAAHEPVAGLVLESTFTTAFRVVTRVPLFPFDRFDNASLIRRVRAPILLIHGRRDEVVPFSHGRRLYAIAGESATALWLDDATHNDIWVVGRAEVGAALQEFAKRL